MSLYLRRGNTDRSLDVQLIPFKMESTKCNNVIKHLISIISNYNADYNLDPQKGVISCQCTSKTVCLELFEDLFYQFDMHCIFFFDGTNKARYP